MIDKKILTIKDKDWKDGWQPVRLEGLFILHNGKIINEVIQSNSVVIRPISVVTPSNIAFSCAVMKIEGSLFTHNIDVSFLKS
jgi:hypothetical protein